MGNLWDLVNVEAVQASRTSVLLLLSLKTLEVNQI